MVNGDYRGDFIAILRISRLLIMLAISFHCGVDTRNATLSVMQNLCLNGRCGEQQFNWTAVLRAYFRRKMLIE